MNVRLPVAGCVVLALGLAIAPINAHAAAPPKDPAPASAPKPFVLGTLQFDAVEFVTAGTQTTGNAAITHTHANHEYWFTTEKNRDAFIAEPPRFEVQMGGSCARMGSLSGSCRTDLPLLHDGRIYIFASPQCRDAFKADPSRCIDADDPPLSIESPERARDLLDRAVAWIGGPDALAAATMISVSHEQNVESDGKTYTQGERTTIWIPAGVRTEQRWDASIWWNVQAHERALSGGPKVDPYPLHAQQRQELIRLRARQLPVILAARNAGTFAASLQPAREGEDFHRVDCRLDGAVSTLLIRDTGQLVGISTRARGPRALLGEVEHRFTAFEAVDGLQLPTMWESYFDGARTQASDRTQGTRWTIETAPTEPDFSPP